MSPVFSSEGFRALRGAWLVLLLAILVGTFFVVGSIWFLDRERKGNQTSKIRLQEARTRVEAARREKENLQESSEVFRTLVTRGLLQSEQRLDLVELINRLRTQHQLFSLDYEVSPQRPLPLAGGRSFTSVEVLASRIKFRVRALHEGDFLAFLDELTRGRQGLYPVDRCVLKRLETATPDAFQPRLEADCTLEWITLKEKRANRPG